MISCVSPLCMQCSCRLQSPHQAPRVSGVAHAGQGRVEFRLYATSTNCQYQAESSRPGLALPEREHREAGSK